MKYGFVLPGGDARTAAELAAAAETAGWDGFFVWEAVWGVDPWVSLAAAAMLTERIRLGTLLTPLPLRKPWKLAGETATLDNLCNGRLILSVGLGAVDTGFANFGEPVERKTRAELLDEGLEILTGLWRGQPYTFDGQHYHLRPTDFPPPPPPVQQPRIPIWVVGAWPRPPSMQRALRWDGLLPVKMDTGGQFAQLTPQDVAEMAAYTAARSDPQQPYDIIVEGLTPGDDARHSAEIVRPWATAGATWWIEAMWEDRDPDHVRKRILQGPPRIE